MKNTHEIRSGGGVRNQDSRAVGEEDRGSPDESFIREVGER